MKSKNVFVRVLVYGAILAAGIAVVGGVIGYLNAGTPGLISALVGTAMAVVFLGITAATMLLSSRLEMAAFFGVVMGAWLLKFVVFIVLVILMRDQPWVEPTVLFLAVVAGVVGTLLVDVVVIVTSRIPYADVSLPEHAPEKVSDESSGPVVTHEESTRKES